MTDRGILELVDSKRDAALAAHRFVHEHPELAHHEHDCSAYLSDVLEQAGLDVDRDIAGMLTAFRATLAGPNPGRSVGIVCLYDAVPVFRLTGRSSPSTPAATMRLPARASPPPSRSPTSAMSCPVPLSLSAAPRTRSRRPGWWRRAVARR